MNRIIDRLKHNRILTLSLIYAVAAVLTAGVAGLCTVISGRGLDPMYYAAETDMLADYAQDGFVTDDIGLEKGIYSLSVSYETNGFASLRAESSEGVRCTSELMLTPYAGYTESYIYASGRGSHIRLKIEPSYEGMTLRLMSVAVYRMPGLTGACRALKIIGAALILYLIVILAIFMAGDAAREKKLTLLGILTVIVIASAGVLPWIFNGYISGGHDVEAHMGRIGAIASGLKGHVFPVRMYRYFENDMGYPMGIFYGDIFLYPSAILHLCGMPLWSCYVTYVLMMNALTAFTAYLSFKTISGRRDIGLLASAVYTLSLWRLNDVYVRAAAGEYGAFAFLPLIALGLYLAAAGAAYEPSTETSADGAISKADPGMTNASGYGTVIFFSLVFGLTGVIHTHIITCVMTAVFAIIYCLIFIRRIVRNGNLKTLILSGAATLILNAGFIVPFVRMYIKGDYVVRHLTRRIGGQGVYPLQLLTFRGDYAAVSHGIEEGTEMSAEMPFTLGPVLILIFILALAGYIRSFADGQKGKDNAGESRIIKDTVFAPVLMGMSVLALFMTTCFFPYDALADLMGPVAAVIGGVQFPWRYLVMATLFLSALTVYVCRIWDKRAVRIILWIVAAASALVFMGKQAAADNKHTDAVSTEGVRLQLMDSDIMYLPNDLDTESLKDRRLRTSAEAASSQDMGFDGVSYTVIADDPGDSDGWVDIPLLYYDGYHSYTVDGNGDVKAKDEYKISEGDDHRIRIAVAAGSRDMVEVRYSEPWYCRISELISLMTLIGLIAGLIWTRQKTGKMADG